MDRFGRVRQRYDSNMTDGYDDGRIVCGPEQMEIHSYYFPLGTKRIAYRQIRGIQRVEIKGPLSGKWRIWGSGNPRYWANLDLKRPKKKAGFIVDLGRRVSPIVTPDDPDAFESVLRARANLGSGTGSQTKGPFI